MSSQRVKLFKRELGYRVIWSSPTVVSFITQTPHYLTSGSLVDIIEISGTTQLINQAVTVVDATTFTLVGDFINLNGNIYATSNGTTLTISDSNQVTYTSGKVVIKYFSTGVTGYQVITSPRNQIGSAVLQSFVTGTGGASYTVNGSLDGIHWSVLSTTTHAGTTGDTQATTIEPSWAYIAINITTIGSATKLTAAFSS